MKLTRPRIYLATTASMTGGRNPRTSATHRYPFHRMKEDNGPLLSPSFLVSFVYLRAWEAKRQYYSYRDWILDSGAFSARQSGKEIDLQEYIETCKRLLASDDTLTEVFALDVIGDWKATRKNVEAMWAAGVPAIPTYHLNEPVDWLKGIAADYPKIAVGGMADLKKKAKLHYARQCFAHVWPKKIHGFGAMSEDLLMGLPWHSVDSTSWELSACRFGRWASFGADLRVKGSKQNLRAEVEFYLALEEKMQARWKGMMAKLEEMDDQRKPVS